MKKKFNILILNGPNLNLLGKREKKIYGNISLSILVNDLIKYSKKLNINLSHFQTNAEHILIEKIHKAKKKIHYIIINPAAFTHTSIALRDSLLAVNIPFIEVHISNIYSRENFRSHSWFSDISNGIICGLGVESYKWALKIAAQRLLKKNN
ncbi:MAG: type II 3-dehydroquinate dehydratase [Buchnera aphidicola (Periphyllus lyropictus)]|uniref:type II 3-dehydroquinate dehydratase n=1 Tax=Buchnera aphidicola TaxID=9 RepID=UPI001EC71734|nr:type II 3-dehydroquinate dehydratase [Buchnera aphidicola]NIH16556.1 type II 3-dehydroquinate dehydratase [Buchnera aphidicola (Periphyllus lyropictus)]USS94449.1 type II 3-dehydroquinate dehydratase [Buchnera aphidicola (Periphyllus lyropictus)]